MAGDHDDQLQWPFVGDIEFMLLNWLEDKGHYRKTLSIEASDGLVRVFSRRLWKDLWIFSVRILLVSTLQPLHQHRVSPQ